MTNKVLYILENVLPKNIPLDIINLISEFCCDCENKLCNFCQESIAQCFLTICANCKKLSCGLEECPKFKIDFIMTYADYHKEIKCCHKCDYC